MSGRKSQARWDARHRPPCWRIAVNWHEPTLDADGRPRIGLDGYPLTRRRTAEFMSLTDPEEIEHQAEKKRAEIAAAASLRAREAAEDAELRRQAARLRAAGVELSPTVRAPNPPLSACADRFLAWLPLSQAKPLTEREYRNRLHRPPLSAYLPLRPEQITPGMVDELRAALAEDGMDPQPIVSCLSSLLAWCVREGMLSANPCHRQATLRRSASSAAARPETIALTRAQRTALIAGMPTGKPRAIVALIACCGPREAEVRGLWPTDVDFKRRELTIDRQLQRIGREWVEDPVCKYRSNRVILVPDGVLALLEPIVHAAARRGDRYLFVPEATRRPVAYIGKDPLWREHLAIGRAAAGIPYHVTPDILRHTAFTLGLAAGLPAGFMDHLLGHAAGRRQGVSEVSIAHYLGRWTDPVDRALLELGCADATQTQDEGDAQTEADEADAARR